MPALLGPPHPQITSFRPLRPSQASMCDLTPPNDRMPHPSLSPHCERAGALPLSLFSDSRPLPPLLVPSNKKRLSRLSIRHHRPPRSGLHHSEAGDAVGGINTGSSSRRLCVPSAAQSSSLPSSPTPRPPPNLDMHNCIPTFSPLFIPMLLSHHPQLP